MYSGKLNIYAIRLYLAEENLYAFCSNTQEILFLNSKIRYP